MAAPPVPGRDPGCLRADRARRRLGRRRHPHGRPSRRDGWVINGTKAFITNSGTDVTGLVTVTAVTGRAAGGRPEISAIIVPAGTPGFTVSKTYSKVGWLASDTRELSFADCRVPAANLLGEEGRGYAQFLEILEIGEGTSEVQRMLVARELGLPAGH